MDFGTKNINLYPTALVEGDKDETLNTVNLEVVDSLTMTAALLHDTEASKAFMPNMDYTISIKDKSDNVPLDTSRCFV